VVAHALLPSLIGGVFIAAAYPAGAQSPETPETPVSSAAAPAAASDDGDAAMRARLEQLETELQATRQRLEALEAAPDSETTAVDDGNAFEEEDRTPSVRLSGMADVTLSGYEQGGETELGLATAGLDLFFVSQLTSSLVFFSEVLLEGEPAGVSAVDVERLLLHWDALPWLRFGAGRGHMALGMWNRRFHHGAWLQTTTTRPAIFEFEDEQGVLPMHYVGVSAEGTVAIPAFHLTYFAALANGRGAVVDEVQILHDANIGKQLSAQVELSPDVLSDFAVAVSGATDQIPTGGGHRGMFEHAAVLSARYTSETIEAFAEGVVVVHQLDDGTALLHGAGYLQAAVRVLGMRPYYRLDAMVIEKDDPFYVTAASPARSMLGNTLGIRFDPFPYACIKLELARTDRQPAAEHRLAAQAAFTF
jgi:hypothetical protein